MNNDPKETVKVLLIEDNRDEATLVKLLLESPRGDDVALEWEESLGGGIERLKRGGFDLVLLDLSLKDSDGFETFRRVREQAPGLPIVVLSGLNEKRTVSLVLGAGAQDYLVKGQVNGHVMRRSIRYAMERHRAGGALRESAERVALRLSKQIVLEYDRARTMTAEGIHDGVGQSLLGLKMEFEMLRRSDADDRSEGGTEKLDRIDSTLQDIMKEVRRLASDLRPPLLDDFGFERALEVYVDEFSVSTGILTSFVSAGDYLPMEKEKEALLFRIAQEALANVRKHSCAKTVEVSLVSGNDELRLSVMDDGKGFEAENPPSGKRLGILGMQNRAEILGGVLDIASKPGSSTTVTVQVPREQQWKQSMSL